jgi:hypothetical protein
MDTKDYLIKSLEELTEKLYEKGLLKIFGDKPEPFHILRYRIAHDIAQDYHEMSTSDLAWDIAEGEMTTLKFEDEDSIYELGIEHFTIESMEEVEEFIDDLYWFYKK